MDDDSDRPTATDAEWRPDIQGQRRYRGRSKPGRMSRAENDRLDVQLAIKSLLAAQDLLDAADNVTDRRERREARKQAKDQLRLARRLIDELLGRER